VRKIIPSALDSEVPADVEPRAADTLATLTAAGGTNFSTLDWKGGYRFRIKVIRKELPLSPDAKPRGKRLEATRRNLFSDATIAGFLATMKRCFMGNFHFRGAETIAACLKAYRFDHD